jgi:serine/threonine-protein kinase
MVAHLLTGSVPFPVTTEEGKLWAHFSEPPPRPSARVPELGTGFDTVVARAMSKQPADRYATAGELSAAMRAALRSPPPARRPPPAPRRVDRGRLAAAATDPLNVALATALLIAGALLHRVTLMVALACLVYGTGVVLNYRDRES